MNPAAYQLLNLAFNALAVGVEREALAARVNELRAAGATDEQVSEALVKMRDEAIAAAQKTIDGA